MKALIQRVSRASVEVSGHSVGQIGEGMLILLGIDRDDDQSSAEKLADRCMNYRIFSDEEGRMNLSLLDTKGDLLLVSQFTLSADTRKGLRPSFTAAASPDTARELYEHFVQYSSTRVEVVETGEFGADMQVSLVNDGPVTFMIES